MNKVEFAKALKIAQTEENLLQVDNSILYGCALSGFVPVYCSILQVAALIKWQAAYFNGSCRRYGSILPVEPGFV